MSDRTHHLVSLSSDLSKGSLKHLSFSKLLHKGANVLSQDVFESSIVVSHSTCLATCTDRFADGMLSRVNISPTELIPIGLRESCARV